MPQQLYFLKDVAFDVRKNEKRKLHKLPSEFTQTSTIYWANNVRCNNILSWLNSLALMIYKRVYYADFNKCGQSERPSFDIAVRNAPVRTERVGYACRLPYILYRDNRDLLYVG